MSFGATAPPLILEGYYSSYSVKWKQACAGIEYRYHEIVRADETLDMIFIRGMYYGTLISRKLSDGSVITPALQTLNVDLYYNILYSLLRKYFAYVVDEGGVPKLKIYKDGSSLQTIDLSASPISWTDTTSSYVANFSTNGKYLLVENTVQEEYALFEGS